MWDGPAVIARIGDAPESYPAWAATRTANSLIRKATIQRFPYVIAFEKHEQHVLIVNPLFARSALGLDPECYTGAISTDYGSKRLEAL